MARKQLTLNEKLLSVMHVRLCFDPNKRVLRSSLVQGTAT